MEDWVTIRNIKKRNPKCGKRKIAELLGISINTVVQALRSDKAPQYQREEKINPDIEPFKDFIFERLTLKNLRGSRVLNEIISKGYKGSQSAFYRYLQTISVQNRRTYKPYETAAGEQAQFDWSPYTVMIAGNLTKVYVFSYILGFSRYRIYEGSLSETQGAVLEALENSLIQTSGVVERIQTDNATCFVTNASKNNFQWNKRYLQFCGHYGLEPSRSLPGHPWSKGKVENPFGYLEDHFIKENSFTGFEDFICKLKAFEKQVNNTQHATTKTSPQYLYDQEKTALMSLPTHRYVGIKEEFRKVTADCLISYSGNKYSVPCLFACKEVWVKISRGCFLQIYSSQNKLIATHSLSLEKGKVLIHNEHYKNHHIERGNWSRLSASFTAMFAGYDWFIDKLKTQKKINHHYQLTKILELAKYYNSTDLISALNESEKYNTYNHHFIRGYLEKNAQVCALLPSPIEQNSSAIIAKTPVSIKRPMEQYNMNNLKKNNHYEHQRED